MVLLMHSLDMKIVGDFGQITLDYDAPFSGQPQIKDFFFKSGASGVKFYPMKTTPKAKTTDFMNFIGANFPSACIVSKKVKVLFESFSGQYFEVGDVDVCHGKNNLEYHVISRPEKMTEEIIDFKSSKIALLNWREQKYDPLNCQSIEEMKKIEGAVFVNVAFRENLICDLHHFVCPIVNMMFISDELAQAMIDAKITGIELYEYNAESDLTQIEIRKQKRLL